ncbi:hypothetical protein E4K10_43650 [Streptomyces sp. T1317-0309]|nr:hypothetical protein E4K10_43650 [Streptomyces sp. T1317-0309]
MLAAPTSTGACTRTRVTRIVVLVTSATGFLVDQRDGRLHPPPLLHVHGGALLEVAAYVVDA